MAPRTAHSEFWREGASRVEEESRVSENPQRKFKVTLEFEIDFAQISAPEPGEYLTAAAEPVALTAERESTMREGMKEKGASDADVEKYIAGVKRKLEVDEKKAIGDPASLLADQFKQWIDAQERLQREVLGDHDLSIQYAREVLRERTEGQIEGLLEKTYGAMDSKRILEEALRRLSEADQMTLKLGEDGLLNDETELLDDAVSCRFSGLEVTGATDE